MQLWEPADVQLCISAVEAVISEIKSDSAGRIGDGGGIGGEHEGVTVRNSRPTLMVLLRKCGGDERI